MRSGKSPEKSTLSESVTSVVTPVAAALMSVIVFYLRSLREHQLQQHAEALRRIDLLEQEVRRLARTAREIERTYATKEEWLRESMSVRRRVEGIQSDVLHLRATIAVRTRGKGSCGEGRGAGRAAGA